MFVIYHGTLQDHMIKTTHLVTLQDHMTLQDPMFFDFMDGSSSLNVTTLSGLVPIGFVVGEIKLFKFIL